MNHSQRNLKKLIRAKEDSIADEELFLSAAYQKYQTSLARAVTGRYRYGLQVLLDWDISEQAGVAYTDNYKVHLNAANPITQSFPTRFLRSQSLTGLTGHEVGHLLYSDFTAHAVHLRSLENGSFYPKEPELSLPAYQTALEEIKEVLEEKDKAGCLTLARCAATFQNILEDIHIEDRMCEEFHGTFRQGIELNNLRMSEQIPSIQEQIDKEYQPFSIIANLILSYCRTGNINNPTGYQGDYLDTISDCTDLLDTAMESEKGTDRMLVSNALLALTWNYIQPLIEKTREELEMHGEDSAADALEDLLGDEVSSGAPLPTGKSGAIPKNIKPASPKGSGNDEGNAPSGPRTKEDAIEEAKQVLSEEGGRIALTKTNTILDENNPGVTYVSQYQGSGYKLWLTKHNLKVMAQTVNLLQEKGLTDEDALNQRIAELEAKYHDSLAVVKDLEGRMKNNKELRHHVAAYTSTKSIAQQLKTAKRPVAFEEQHRAELTAHRAAAAYFKANNITKLPSPKKLEAEYAQLASEKAKFYEQYKEAKEELLKLKTAKQNVASFFREEEPAQQER